eukprot:IDg20046t1
MPEVQLKLPSTTAMNHPPAISSFSLQKLPFNVVQESVLLAGQNSAEKLPWFEGRFDNRPHSEQTMSLYARAVGFMQTICDLK